MTHSPLTRLQKFRRTVFTAYQGNSSGTLDTDQGAGLSDHRLFSGRRHRNFLYQCRTADTFMYLDHLFPRYGDGRTYDHLQLPDVRVFPVWKESSEYLGDPARCIPLLPLPQETHVQLHLHRFLRHQPVPDHHADHVYLAPALRSPAHHKSRSRTHHRLRAAAVIHPCSLFPQRLLPL